MFVKLFRKQIKLFTNELKLVKNNIENKKIKILKTAILSGFFVFKSINSWAVWPYKTEEASNLKYGQGSCSIGLGRTIQYESYKQFGVLLTPAEGSIWTIPEVQTTLGLSNISEFSLEYKYLSFRSEGGKETLNQSGDVKLWTKIRAPLKSSVDVSFRFGMKIPSSSNEQGLGTDETDVFLNLLLGSNIKKIRVDFNAGLEIMGDPTKDQSQDDLFVWGLSLKTPIKENFIIGVESTGASGPFNVLKDRNFAQLAAVISWKKDLWRFDFAAKQERWDSESFGWIFGVTYDWL